jgi:hypothetical protein
MSMWLACTAVFTRVEKGEQTSGRVGATAFTPCPEAGIGDGQVVFFEDVSLRLRSLGSNDGMVWNDGIFVED